MTPQEFDALRKETKKRMIDLDLDRLGTYDMILPRVTEVAGFPISKSQLCMALTGYRRGGKQPLILEALRKLLLTWPTAQGNYPVSPV